MKQLYNSDVAIVHINENTNDGRTFNYVMNEKRTKNKLIKGAKRTKNLEVEFKTTCANLRFSDGAYYEIMLPLLNSWSEKVNETVLINELEIKVIEFETGLDSSHKHVDSKVIILAGSERFVLHAYNTTVRRI